MDNQSANRYKQKAPSRGGARQGAGRPKGSTNKITMEGLIASLDSRLGVSYADQIANNYVEAINREDWSGVRDYDKVFLSKVVADKTEVTTVEGADAVEQRAQAFAEALTTLAVMGKKNG